MSSAYWNQWDRSEIESMHDICTENDLDYDLYCYKEEYKLDENDEPVTYNFTTWEAI